MAQLKSDIFLQELGSELRKLPMSDTVRMTIKALDTEDAHVVAAVSRNLLMTRGLEVIMGQVPPVTQTQGYPPADNASVGTPPAPPAGQTPAPMVTEGEQVTFELKSCVYSGSSVKCDLIFTNKGDDRASEIDVRGRTKLFDDQGRESLANDGKVGSHTPGWGIIGSELVSGVPTRAQLVFEKVAPDISFISKLEISCNVGGKDFFVSFRKVPLSGRR
jgi:hypothetical protein